MYFRMKPSSWWTCPSSWPAEWDSLIFFSLFGVGPTPRQKLLLPSLLFRRFGQPVIKCLFRRIDRESRLHSIMSDAAQLCAGDLVLSRLRRREPYFDAHPGHRVLLHSQVWKEEAVSHVF